MAYGRKLLANVDTDELGVGVRRHQLGMRGLDLLQLHQVAVKLRVRHLRVVQCVVRVRRMGKDAVQLRRARGRRGRASASPRHLRGLVLPKQRELRARRRHLPCVPVRHALPPHVATRQEIISRHAPPGRKAAKAARARARRPYARPTDSRWCRTNHCAREPSGMRPSTSATGTHLRRSTSPGFARASAPVARHTKFAISVFEGS